MNNVANSCLPCVLKVIKSSAVCYIKCDNGVK